MLMWRSGSWSSLVTGPSIADRMRLIVLAVGRLRPPYADDVRHYQKLLAGLARLELVEVREDDRVARRIPEPAFVSLLASDGSTYDSLEFARWIEERRQGRRDVC